MSMIITQPAQAISLPPPRVAIDVRPATLDDLAFIDGLQKKHTRQVGFMHRKALEAKIAAGHVLVAEERHEGTEARRHEVTDCERKPSSGSGPFVPSCLRASVPSPLGFIIGTDRYFKRDDCGIIYQLCIELGQRRSLVGAMLVKAMFDRAAYGCRLFCCWCAQDIEANHFWESLGFVPLAYRAGSAKKSRVHIFWQRRIREGDEATPWWFPAKTDSGSMREDRLVLPIPPGLHWSEPMPVITPHEQAPRPDRARKPALVPGMIASPQEPTPHPQKRIRVQFGPPPIHPVAVEPEPKPAQQKPPRQKRKADPRLIAAARELRDRWLEKVERDPSLLLPAGKYDIARALPEAPDRRPVEPRQIESEVKALPEAA